MDAKELRIGNLIFWNIPEKINIPHEVLSLSKDNIRTKPISIFTSFEDFKPIPLTEEWLLKFGFEKTYDDDEYYFLLNEFHLENRAKDNYSKDINKEDFGCWKSHNYLRELKYVHQLQNLYFALTGEELKIK